MGTRGTASSAERKKWARDTRVGLLPVGGKKVSLTLRACSIIAIILFGMIAGAGAQLVLQRGTGIEKRPLAFVTGILGSFLGGLFFSFVAGDGLDLKPSGIIGVDLRASSRPDPALELVSRGRRAPK